MTYTGTLIRELESMVEMCIQRSMRICATCGHRYGDHSECGVYCPAFSSLGKAYLQTSFAELCLNGKTPRGRANVSVRGYEIYKSRVAGQGFFSSP